MMSTTLRFDYAECAIAVDTIMDTVQINIENIEDFTNDGHEWSWWYLQKILHYDVEQALKWYDPLKKRFNENAKPYIDSIVQRKSEMFENNCDERQKEAVIERVEIMERAVITYCKTLSRNQERLSHVMRQLEQNRDLPPFIKGECPPRRRFRIRFCLRCRSRFRSSMRYDLIKRRKDPIKTSTESVPVAAPEPEPPEPALTPRQKRNHKVGFENMRRLSILLITTAYVAIVLYLVIATKFSNTVPSRKSEEPSFLGNAHHDAIRERHHVKNYDDVSHIENTTSLITSCEGNSVDSDSVRFMKAFLYKLRAVTNPMADGSGTLFRLS